MSVTCQFNGRLGNILFNMAHVIAYCKQHNLQYWFSTYAWACTNGQVPISVQNTGEQPVNPQIYIEPQIDGHPYYHTIPPMDNVEFRGYYQSFRYFDDYRQDVLDAINLPWEPELGIVGVHSRRGDCIAQPEGFPIAPREYYQAAIRFMQEKGYNRFRIYGDDPQWQMQEFTQENYPDAKFEYRQNGTEVEDFISLSQCQHIITARSTFSLMAGWFNQYGAKWVLCPSIEQHYWWHGQNNNLLDIQFLTQINW